MGDNAARTACPAQARGLPLDGFHGTKPRAITRKIATMTSSIDHAPSRTALPETPTAGKAPRRRREAEDEPAAAKAGPPDTTASVDTTAARLTELEQQLALLGHNMRNPLNAISAAIEVLNRSAADAPRAIRAREIIAHQTERLAAIVNRFAHHTSERSVDFAAVVDLSELVRTRLPDLRAEAAASHRSIQASLSSGLVPAQRESLEACVDQLLRGALDLTPIDGSLHVQVRPAGTLVELTLQHRSALGEASMPEPERFEHMALPIAARLQRDDPGHCLRFSLPGGRVA